jgi:hypothetical protein
MMKFYPKEKLNQLLLLLIFLFNLIPIYAQSYTEDFNTDRTGGGQPTTFTSTIGGVPFIFTFTADGGGGYFEHLPDKGKSNSSSLGAFSSDKDLQTTERISIKRTDGQLFELRGLYLNNALGGLTPIMYQTYNSSVVSDLSWHQGIDDSVDLLPMYPGTVVITDEIRISAGDMAIALDDFTWTVTPQSPIVVSNVTSTTSNGLYGIGRSISVDLEFSEAVTVTETPQLTFETGPTDRVVNYTSGTGTKVLTFTYTVQPGDRSADLDYISSNSLHLNGGTIRDETSTDAVLTLPSPGTTGSLGANKALVVDGVAPTATILVGNTALRIGDTSLVTFTFSEPVTGFTNADLTLTNGTLSSVSSGDGGITWTATVTPTSNITNATNVITLANSAVVDRAGNQGTGTTDSNNYAIDTVRPTATNVVVQSALRAGDTSLVTITFSEAVTGFTNADLSITNGTLTAVTSFDGGITWTATFTPTANITDLTNLISLANTGVVDAAGNTGAGTTDSNNYAIDTRRPTATIVVSDTSLEIGETSSVTITFSEAVSGFTNADLLIPNGTLSSVTSADGGTNWTATFTPTANITDLTNFIALANTGVSNTSGNTGIGTTNSNNYAIDTLRPIGTIVVAKSVLKAGDTSLITITFSEAVTGFTNADLVIPNGTLSSVSSSDGNVTWTATFTPTANITDLTNLISLANTAVVDAAGNTGAGTTDSNNFAIDTRRPTATIVVADTSLIIGETSLVTITFSEAVSGFTNADLVIPNGTLSSVSSADGYVTWTATFTPTANIKDATNFITLANTGVSNTSGNPGTGTTNSNNYAINTVRPTAKIVVANTSLKIGDTSLVTITFSEAFTGFNFTYLMVVNGTIGGLTTSNGGITWTATLTPSASTTDATNVITLNNTGVVDAAGNTGAGTTDSNNYAIDTRRPTATIVVSDTSLKIGETSLVTITFSEAVSGFTNEDFVILKGTLSSVSSADGGVTWTATLTPTSNITDATNIITLDNNGVADLAGNAGTGTTDSNFYAVDTTSPTILGMSVPANGSYSAGHVLYFNAIFSENVTVNTFGGTPQLNITIGTTGRQATFFTGSSTSTLLFRYTVQAGDLDTNGITVQSLVLNGSTIQNDVGNPANLFLNNIDSTTDVLVDAVAPSAPSTPNLENHSDTGSSATDNVTMDDTPTFYGTAEPNTIVEILNNSILLGDTNTDGSGNWSFTSISISEGTFVITARAKDAAGNTSGLSAGLSITIDTTAPNQPSTPVLLGTSDTGSSNTDNITNATTPTFTGLTESAVINFIYSNTYGIIGTSASASDGKYTCTSRPLSDGVHLITSTAVDLAGNVSTSSIALSLSIDTAKPSGYSVTIDQDPITETNQSAISFTFSGAEVGTSYNYTFSSDGGGSPVTGNGIVKATNEQITGINLNGLNSGEITVSVILKDIAGNQGTLVNNKSTKLQSITGVTLTTASFVFDETAKALSITGTLPSGTNIAYSNNSRTDVGTQEVTATISGSNYTTLVLKADLSITPATITAVTFNSDSFVFDETAKALSITGTLPSGTNVVYSNNSRTDVGTQEVTATISGSNYTTLVLKADLSITPATITAVNFNSDSFVFDETTKALSISGTLPSGTNVVYSNNSRTDVGTQEVTATVSGSNYTTLVLKADLSITPATITAVTFNSANFVFDETAKALSITGTLPSGTNVVYSNNSRTDVGTQEVTATISGSNYTTLVLKADLSITPATITAVTLTTASFVFDETTKALSITGTLPSETNVVYSNNSRTDVGTQEVTATISGSNYTTLVLKADLSITPATITAVTLTTASFVFDETTKALSITGTLPSGTNVAYSNNSRTDVGTQEVTATISGSNYTTLVLKAGLSITPATITAVTFNSDSFVFDETAKVLSITGTLPSGTNVAYSNNSRTDVGTQEVTATISGSNYTTLVLKADLSITPATITAVTFNSDSFVFDETTKALSITGTLPSGTSVVYSNNSRTDVGTQEVTATISGSNYITLVLKADLSITKKVVLITVNPNQTKIFGETDPVFTYTITGLNQSLLRGSLTRATGENVGNYLISLGDLTAGNNYEISIQTFNFEITKANQKITWNQDLNFGCYTADSIDLLATTTSGLPITYSTSDSRVADIKDTELIKNNSGTAHITAIQPGDQNYNPATAVIKIVNVSQINLIRQHWDDVLVFDNSSENFVAFQWYKNGAAITGATNQFYNENGALNGDYYAVATTKTGQKITSCPLELSGQSFANKIKIFPNPVPVNSKFEVECSFDPTSLTGGTITVFDLTGKVLATYPTTGTTTQATAPSHAGIYIVSLNLAKGEQRTMNLLVK